MNTGHAPAISETEYQSDGNTKFEMKLQSKGANFFLTDCSIQSAASL